MRSVSPLIALAGVTWCLLVGAVALRATPADTRAQVTQPAITPSSSSSTLASADYLGSASCERCHEAEYRQWRGSLHVRMTRPVADAEILGDFGPGSRFADHGRSYTFSRRNGQPTVSVSYDNRPPESFAVDYTLGSKRYQGYLSKLPDGRIYVLPVFWHVQSRRWMDWKEITPVPDGAHELRQIWNANCFNCHATNLVQGYDVKARRYDTTWTEPGIGCEACHGPGRPHVQRMDAWEKDPRLKPATYDAASPDASDTLQTLAAHSAPPRRVYDTCAYCHGNKTNLFVGFKAGDRYEDYALPFLLSGEIPANDAQGEFWPDGRPNRFNRNQALTLSGCFQAGAITCTNCHVAHGSPNEHSLKWNIYQGRSGDNHCTQCHSESRREAGSALDREAGGGKREAEEPRRELRVSFVGEGLSAHTFHAPESTGSRCVNCHMSDVNWRLLIRRRDHTFQAPTPEITARYGVPNACNTCHDDKTPEWAAAQMTTWWGEGDRARRERLLTLADTMYRAGSGDAAVIPELMRVAVDRTHGAVLRASAVDYLARLLMGPDGAASATPSQTTFVDAAASSAPGAFTTKAVPTPALANTLIGAAADNEPMVRAAAVKALAATNDLQRVLPALTARLVDQTRVVRVRAVEALLTLGVVSLPGQPGVVLAKAQDEYVESLEAFPDAVGNHAARAWFEAARGRLDAAERALDDARLVDDKAPRPYVIRGILAARAGRYQDAIDWWKKARER
ncbi:MAG: HEAT repeat domain-containing protein, partial [Acidobacteria bacterium]|nr:HEAT repeat domain-containing protein [Acidobacteriota bacterium]